MASRIVDSLPASWFDCALKEQVRDWVAQLPIDPEDRKTAFLDWCRATDCDCTAFDFAFVTHLPPGEV